MANGQTSFKPLRGAAAGQQIQRAGQTGTAGPPQLPNPNAVPPPGGMPVQRTTAPSDRIPPGLMRFLNRGAMLPNPNAVAPQGMVPGQPQLQRAAFEPGAFTPTAPVGLQDPNAVAPVGLQQFQLGVQAPPGRGPLVPQGGIPMRQPVAMGGSFLGVPGRGPLVPEGPMPAFAGGIPSGQGQIPRNLLNLAMRRTGFMPQLGFFGP